MLEDQGRGMTSQTSYRRTGQIEYKNEEGDMNGKMKVEKGTTTSRMEKRNQRRGKGYHPYHETRLNATVESVVVDMNRKQYWANKKAASVLTAPSGATS